MKNLSHKGWKSTRMQWALIMFIASTVVLYVTELTPIEYLDFLKWLFGSYAISEVGAKVSEAYRDKGS